MDGSAERARAIKIMTGIKLIDGAIGMGWYQAQLQRMGNGTTLHPTYNTNLDSEYFGRLESFYQLTLQTKNAGQCGPALDLAEAGDEGVRGRGGLPRPARPADQRPQLGEGAGVEQEIQPLARVQPAFPVPALQLLGPAQRARLGLAPLQLLEQRLPVAFVRTGHRADGTAAKDRSGYAPGLSPGPHQMSGRRVSPRRLKPACSRDRSMSGRCSAPHGTTARS